MAGYDVREEGIDPDAGPRMVFYASSETHSSVRKAIELLGLGRKSLRSVPVLDDFTIDMDALGSFVAADREAGLQPAAVIGNAGTVNTGAVDPIEALADFCRDENLWLHIDGAFGAFARLSDTAAPLVAGLERADSLAFDLHKWLYVQYDCGCVLVQRQDVHKDTFSVVPSYIRNLDRGLASGPINFSEYGVQLSRSFRALRAWMALKSEGVERYGRQIEQNVRQASFLAGLVEQAPDLELLAPTSLNIVNFRYVAAKATAQQLDDLNREILMVLQERGIATPSSTVLNGSFAIRVAICNHRSRRSDFDTLVRETRAIGDELSRCGPVATRC